jgi:hypothetical protein
MKIRSFLLVGALLIAGCGRAEPRGSVKGTVTRNGEPVSGAIIFLENVAAGVGITANLGEDGSFEIKSYKGAGLPVGTYKAAVSPGRVMESADEIPLAGKKTISKTRPVSVAIPEKYHKTSTSSLEVEVKEGENPPLVIDLKD